MDFTVKVADDHHLHHAETICRMMEAAARIRGTGIAKRSPEYIRQKMQDGQAIIALDQARVIGFCYIESWENKRYVANSGLIVHPDYRKTGLARAIKHAAFRLSRQKFPEARVFGITTSLAVMKINSELGYKPVTFSELPQDETFWKGCQTCVNYDVLQRTKRTMCLCTGMVAEPVTPNTTDKPQKNAWENFQRFLRLRRLRIQRKLRQYPSLKKAFKNEKQKSNARL